MTRQTCRRTLGKGGWVLAGTALAVGTAMVGAVLAVWADAGSTAARGVLVGVLLVLAVFGLGTSGLHAVASARPAAALTAALVIYTLQTVFMGLALWRLRESGVLSGESSERWLVGAVILGTLWWLCVHTILVARSRIPIYDLHSAVRPGGER
jgi:hypothetical protein